MSTSGRFHLITGSLCPLPNLKASAHAVVQCMSFEHPHCARYIIPLYMRGNQGTQIVNKCQGHTPDKDTVGVCLQTCLQTLTGCGTNKVTLGSIRIFGGFKTSVVFDSFSGISGNTQGIITCVVTFSSSCHVPFFWGPIDLQDPCGKHLMIASVLGSAQNQTLPCSGGPDPCVLLRYHSLPDLLGFP